MCLRRAKERDHFTDYYHDHAAYLYKMYLKGALDYLLVSQDGVISGNFDTNYNLPWLEDDG